MTHLPLFIIINFFYYRNWHRSIYMKSQNPSSVSAFITAILRADTLGGFYQWYYRVDQNIRELQVSNYISISLTTKKKTINFALGTEN